MFLKQLQADIYLTLMAAYSLFQLTVTEINPFQSGCTGIIIAWAGLTN